MYGGSGTSPTRATLRRDRRRNGGGSPGRRRRRARPSAREAAAERNRLASGDATGASRDASPPVLVVERLDEQHLDGTARRSPSVESGCHDFGVIDDQDIAGPQPIPEPLDGLVRARFRGPLDDQHAAPVPRRERLLRDQRRIERIVQNSEIHGRIASSSPESSRPSTHQSDCVDGQRFCPPLSGQRFCPPPSVTRKGNGPDGGVAVEAVGCGGAARWRAS